MTQLFLLAALAAGPVQDAAPPPLAEDQLVRLRELVRTTQAASGRLQEQLAERQRALAAEYARFELDEEKAGQLQDEILDLQRKRLENYHRLQVELRSIVGPQRFALLKRRIDEALKSPRPKPAEKDSGAVERGAAEKDTRLVRSRARRK